VPASQQLKLPARGAGRPRITTNEGIRDAALELFDKYGFDAITMEEIAHHAGISRRTLFRYFENKQEILWGGFSERLQSFQVTLEENAAKYSLREALVESILEFNRFPLEEVESQRARLHLIFGSPSLLNYSTVKYGLWKNTISDFLIQHGVGKHQEWFPVLIADLFLVAAFSAFAAWLEHEDLDLELLQLERYVVLIQGLDSELLSQSGQNTRNQHLVQRKRK
jgi:AcrR family transcriptional regulator